MDLLDKIRDVALFITLRHAEQDEQSKADATDHLTLHLDGRASHALNDCFHLVFAIIVPGYLCGDGARFLAAPSIATAGAWLRRQHTRGAVVCGSCSGVFLLGEAGLLDGYKCTIHWENLPGFSEAFPEIDATGGLFEIDRDRFTSAGGTTALDMMLTMIASQHGADLAASVAEAVLHSPIRHHSEHQRMSLPARIGARHPKLVGIIEQMEKNLEDPLSPSLLAKQSGLSTRQLERLFRRYLDRSPKRYYLELRLKKARSLLLQTDMSVINVALACGFSSPSHFSKCYRAFYGRTPYRERGIPVIDHAAAE